MNERHDNSQGEPIAKVQGCRKESDSGTPLPLPTDVAEPSLVSEDKDGVGSSDIRLMRRFQKYAHLIRNRKGGGQGQGRLLAFVSRHGPLTQRKLQAFADIRSSSVSELLSKLESDGLIARDKCDNDKRNVSITLTEQGRAAAAEYERVQTQLAEGLFSALTEAEKAQLGGIMDKLLAALREDLEQTACRHNHDGQGRCGGAFRKHLHGCGGGHGGAGCGHHGREDGHGGAGCGHHGREGGHRGSGCGHHGNRSADT
ncbi:hypothetical protein SDC9_128566 [bioreactor metagenome]|uniref:HTH marR-type domain-containing protein n=1 Tax=bioreactor metagenome TaxID=1076179 RepID=A0A645CXB1_9ZZZZ